MYCFVRPSGGAAGVGYTERCDKPFISFWLELAYFSYEKKYVVGCGVCPPPFLFLHACVDECPYVRFQQT